MSLSWRTRPTCLFPRLIVFLCLWLVVSGVSVVDFMIGTLTAIGTTWASIALLPCSDTRPRFFAWIRLILPIPFQAFAAGADVARRALDPSLPLHPGFVAYSTNLPPGTAQNALAGLAALQPGSVPIRSDAQGNFDIHCLDARLPVVVTLMREEAELREALGLERDRG
ncbi:Na+/H+ antiporter subunit E [Methylocystis sp. ATCC 49242]|uniref:Na+/H+ antiporter subunit E n=1 Tax=Methylocystis sp. ATCC 49242 TaxID=622637 RepID=UPI0001F8861A|nr:Na+/H+ antiporter subunit E [Methylocystis sp. ATCC 49242]